MSLSPPEHIAAQVRSSSTLPASPVPAAALQPPLRAFLQTGGALLATFAVGFGGGIVAKLLHFPLPYMTGSLLITAALGLAAVPVRSLWQVRAAGQFVTGAAIGSSFTPAVVGHLLLLLPLIVVAAAISIVVAGLPALMVMRMRGSGTQTP